MQGFLILILLVLAGLAVIGWIMYTEKKKESPHQEEKPKSQLSPNDMMGRLGLEISKSAATTSIAQKSKPALSLPAVAAPPGTTKNDVAALKSETELSLKYDELLTEHKELKDKYAKLDLMFNEKSSGLERSEKTLNDEFKNQKEFNKSKDILEKELKDTKDKCRALQVEVTTAQTETQAQTKRVSQLEENVKKLEISLLSSEAAINDAQSATQLARKKITELEGKLRDHENQILEKNQKIEDLVNRLKDLPNIFPGNTLAPGSSTEQEIHLDQSPIPPAEEIPSPAAPQEQHVVEKEGADSEKDEKASTPPPLTKVPKETDSLALPPDIFADKKQEPSESPPPEKTS